MDFANRATSFDAKNDAPRWNANCSMPPTQARHRETDSHFKIATALSR
jgi:hypothetical protein